MRRVSSYTPISDSSRRRLARWLVSSLATSSGIWCWKPLPVPKETEQRQRLLGVSVRTLRTRLPSIPERVSSSPGTSAATRSCDDESVPKDRL